MPKVSQMVAKPKPRSVMIYGPSKSGKTELVAHLAELGFNLHVFDMENSLDTYLKLSPEAQDRVNYNFIYDTKSAPNGINTCLRLITGEKHKVCIKHGKIGCASCIAESKEDPEAITEICLADLDPTKDIVLFDSFTQLTSSANAHVTSKLKEHETEEYSHWRRQGTLLEKFLDLCQNPVCNVIVISHELGIEQSDKSELIVPAGGTKNFARNVGRYFGDIIYLSVKNGRHKAYSQTISISNAMTGGRSGVNIDDDPKGKIGEIFNPNRKVGPSTTATTSAKPKTDIRSRFSKK